MGAHSRCPVPCIIDRFIKTSAYRSVPCSPALHTWCCRFLVRWITLQSSCICWTRLILVRCSLALFAESVMQCCPGKIKAEYIYGFQISWPPLGETKVTWSLEKLIFPVIGVENSFLLAYFAQTSSEQKIIKDNQATSNLDRARQYFLNGWL